MDVPSPIRVLVVDDHAILRSGLAAMIDRQTGMDVVAEAGNGWQAVELFRRHNPDVTLIDLVMPVMDGVEAIGAIRREFPQSRFIVLTTFDGDEDIHRAIQAGAQGYLLKGMKRDELFEAIRAVHAGSRYIPKVVSRSLDRRKTGPGLTKRELEVLKLIMSGKSNREIADALLTTEGTIKSYVVNILNKLDANDRTQAVTTALKRGFVHL
jgi:two-component system NarL family response regulator